jgi:hypothetical protein
MQTSTVTRAKWRGDGNNETENRRGKEPGCEVKRTLRSEMAVCTRGHLLQALKEYLGKKLVLKINEI